MKEIKGNLIDLAEQGIFDIIIHGCNCFHTMGAGIAKEISTRYPEALIADKKFSDYGCRLKLGNYTFVEVKSRIKPSHHFTIINAYTQFTYKKKNNKNLIYNNIKYCFQKISEDLFGQEYIKIGYPKIGAGLAGGDWLVISKIIDEQLFNFNHTLVIL